MSRGVILAVVLTLVGCHHGAPSSALPDREVTLAQSGGYGVPADGSAPGIWYIRLWENSAGVHGETVSVPYGSSEKTRRPLRVSEPVLRTALVQLDSLLSAATPRTTTQARYICGDLIRYGARLWKQGRFMAGATSADCGEEGEGLAARDAILVGTFERLLSRSPR